jgi:hypothetical protein
MVRGYEATSGQLLWDDRSHPSHDRFIDRFLFDLAVGKSRLFVVGYTVDEDHSHPSGIPMPAASGQDFLIRAYDVRSDVSSP